jgi:hypothetical protein
VLDKKRLENGAFLDEDYFETLLAEIREIRLSERRFYQKITDIYSTSVDYNKDDLTTRDFFAKVQNKLHFAIHGHTAAELIMKRADSDKEHMGNVSLIKFQEQVKPFCPVFHRHGDFSFGSFFREVKIGTNDTTKGLDFIFVQVVFGNGNIGFYNLTLRTASPIGKSHVLFVTIGAFHDQFCGSMAVNGKVQFVQNF